MRWSPPEQNAQPPSLGEGPLPVSRTQPTSGDIRAWSSTWWYVTSVRSTPSTAAHRVGSNNSETPGSGMNPIVWRNPPRPGRRGREGTRDDDLVVVPRFAELTASARVVRVPMRVPMRGVTEREAVLLRGPAGWGEFAPFVEYGDAEAARWLAAAVAAAWEDPPVPVRTEVP